jgi:hypothetical protein
MTELAVRRLGSTQEIIRLIDDGSECNFLDNRCEWSIKSCDLPVVSARLNNAIDRKAYMREYCAIDERLAVRSAKRSDPRRVAKTSASQSTPFARQVAASRAPLLRMRSLWTGYLSARHDFWPRSLSVGTHPTVTTYKDEHWKDASVPQIHRPCDKCGVWSVGLFIGRPHGGSGRFRDPRLA